MARDESPPFPLGQTYYNGLTIDTTNLGGVNLEGKEYVFDDLQFGTGIPIRARIVRNAAVGNLLPKFTAQYDKTTYFGKRVTGYVTVDGDYGYPIDPQLPVAGVVPNDLFYIIISGPTLVKTSLQGGATNVINVGDILTNQTAATSGATTAGRVNTQVLSAATTAAANINSSQYNNVVGRAMSAATTGNTNADLLAQIGRG